MIQDCWIIVKKEILGFLRDRNTMIYSVLLPIFLYPVMFWVMSQIMMYQRGAVEAKVSKVAIQNLGYAPDLYGLLIDQEMFEVIVGKRQVSADDADVLIEVADVHTGRGGPCYHLKIYYDRTRDSSEIAKDRVEDALVEFRDGIMSSVARDQGLPPDMVRSYEIESVNVASKENMGSFIIGRLLPLMIIIMAAMGTLYPSIDVLVGERERNTLETTLLSPVSRVVVIAGKFAAVVVAGVCAVVLNTLSLGLTAGHTIFLLSDTAAAATFKIPLRAYPLILITVVIITSGFSAVCILLASYARTFREGQSYVTPFFVLSFQPAVIAAIPSVKLTAMTALIPVSNAALMFRDVISGVYQWDKIALTVGSLALYSIIALLFAARRLQHEDTFWGQPRMQTSSKSHNRFARWRSRS